MISVVLLALAFVPVLFVSVQRWIGRDRAAQVAEEVAEEADMHVDDAEQPSTKQACVDPDGIFAAAREVDDAHLANPAKP
jgi:hypothetical protein